ncbi:L,D-transpeptidase [Gemmobacter lanyuensis]|nr:L,D-transpeptidase [Gemmobacter lanyuensis]
MLRTVMGIVMGGVLIGTLSACVPTDTTPALTGATKAPEPQLPPPVPADVVQAYSAKQDGSFVVPAVPADKVPAHLRRQEVEYASTDPVGTIIIDPTAKTLHLVTAPGKAMRYGIAVGKDGFQWAGEAMITNRRHWPTWTPPPEMIARKPELSKWENGQPGGPTNPLGARALYLTTNGVDYGFRIHGTPEWQSIGRNASSGCFRMINQDVMDLYERVPNGVKVVVLNADGTRPTKLKLPPPAPKKSSPKPAPKPETPAAATTPATPETAPAGVTPAPTPATPALPAAPAAPLAGVTTPGALTTPATPPAIAVTPAPAVIPATPAPAAPAPLVAPTATPVVPAPAAPVATAPVVQPMTPAAPAPATPAPAPATPAPAPAATPAPVAPANPAPAAATTAAPAASGACVPTAEKPCP